MQNNWRLLGTLGELALRMYGVGHGGQVVRVVTYMGCLVPLCVVKDEEWNPEPLNILESERILRAAFLQVEILDPVVVPANYKWSPYL